MRTIEDLLEDLSQRLQEQTERQKATARAVTTLADGLSSADRAGRRRDEEIQEGLLSTLAIAGELRSGTAEIIAIMSDIRLKSDPGQLTAQEIADLVPHAVICEARQIQFARGEANSLPAPLPPAPAKEDDSLTVQAHPDGARIRGSIKAKTLAGWAFGVAMLIWNIWHTISNGGH